MRRAYDELGKPKIFLYPWDVPMTNWVSPSSQKYFCTPETCPWRIGQALLAKNIFVPLRRAYDELGKPKIVLYPWDVPMTNWVSPSSQKYFCTPETYSRRTTNWVTPSSQKFFITKYEPWILKPHNNIIIYYFWFWEDFKRCNFHWPNQSNHWLTRYVLVVLHRLSS